MQNKEHMKFNVLALMILLASLACFSSCKQQGNDEAKSDKTSSLFTTDSIEYFHNKKIGFISGYGSDLEIKAYYKDLNLDDVIFTPLNSLGDGIVSLKYQKIDAFVIDGVIGKDLARRNPDFFISGVKLEPMSYVFAFRKNDSLASKVKESMIKLKETGVLDSIVDKWTCGDSTKKVLGDQDWDAPNGSFIFGAESGDETLFYMQEEKFMGLDMDIMYHVAQMLGMKIEVRDITYDALTVALQKNKVDIIGGGYVYIEEAGEEVDYSIPYLDATAVFVMKKSNQTEAVSFWDSFKDSINKNFIRESRWKLILNGLKISVLISICAGVIGFLLGFGICMLRHSKSKVSRATNIAFVKLIQGTPIVVLLMIVYYVIFGSIDIPGVIAAIIAFSINFAAYTSEMIRSSLDTVDKGQMEASYSLGFNRIQTFWMVVFPQAAKNFLPVVRGEFISLLKNTSIVGYISVVDLTKATDIIRARTMEAFFPLILTALIYFVVAWLMAWCLERIEINVDPKRRRGGK